MEISVEINVEHQETICGKMPCFKGISKDRAAWHRILREAESKIQELPLVFAEGRRYNQSKKTGG